MDLRKIFSPKNLLIAAALSALQPVGISVAWAAQLEEIVVTAQKREERLQDVPITISAFSSLQLEDRGFNSVSDLTMMTPSMQFGNFGPITFVSMRGIGNENTTAGGDPGVAMHIDGIYLGRPVTALFTAFDTERVEVLRGPQGTLYGRNATGGSINLITKKPVIEEFSGELDLTYGDYNWRRVRGRMNLPLGDTSALRIAVYTEDRDGYTENLFAGGKDENDLNDWGVRGHLSFELGDKGSLLFSAAHIDSGGVGAQPEAREPFPGTTTTPVSDFAGPPGFAFNPLGPASGQPYDKNYLDPATGTTFGPGPTAMPVVNNLTPFVVSKDLDQFNDNSLTLFSATFEWDFDQFTFKSISGYAKSNFEIHKDEDYSILDLAELVLTEKSEQFSQEFQFLSSGDGPLDWIAGFYYFNEDVTRRSTFLRGRYETIAANVSGFFGRSIPSAFDVGGDVESESFALFGQASYAVSDTVRVTAGARYTDDEKTGRNFGAQFLGGNVTSLLPATFFDNPNNALHPSGQFIIYDERVGQSWDELTYQLSVDWQFSDASMLYSSYSTGYKSGGINQVPVPSLVSVIYSPEFVDAFEVGLKSTLFDSRMQLNASLYHNKYEDLQFQVFRLAGPEAFNAKGATVQGLEVEIQAAVTDSLVLDATIGLTDSEFDNQELPTGGGATANIGGNQVQRTPDLTYSLGLVNEWTLEDRGSLRLRLEYSYTDEIYYTAFNRRAGFGDLKGNDLAGDYSNANARLFWFSPDEKWTVELSVTNITDEVQEGNVFRDIGFLDIPGGGGTETIAYNPPRQWAVRIGYQF
ncbi:MAG TPA: TonB-dependent receptor [Gammaproteobacteria bacterium]|nr:TonB-dependent receptor [Gammaproteobacteria bacterium]